MSFFSRIFGRRRDAAAPADAAVPTSPSDKSPPGPPLALNDLAQLVGFIAAHAIWCVSDDGPLTPMIGYQQRDGSRGLVRFADEDLAIAAAKSRDWLASNTDQVAMAVAAVDGFINLATGKSDAILLESCLYGAETRHLRMAVPYRPKTEAAPFAVFRPKFTQIDDAAPDHAALADAFFNGVDGHMEGAKVWEAHWMNEPVPAVDAPGKDADPAAQDDPSLAIMVDIAGGLVAQVRALAPDWQRAFLRFEWLGGGSDIRASYVHATGVELVDVMAHSSYFDGAQDLASRLSDILRKDQGVFLLRIDSTMNYAFDFEYQDLQRWRITKLGGHTGIPVGIAD